MPATVTPAIPDRRLFCELTNGPIVHLGLISQTKIGADEPPALIQFQHGTTTYDAALVRVTPKLVYYRQSPLSE